MSTLSELDATDVAMDVRFLLDDAEVDGLEVTAAWDGAEVAVTFSDGTADRVFLLTVREVQA